VVVDGFQAEHDALRGPGAFVRTLAGLAACAEIRSRESRRCSMWVPLGANGSTATPAGCRREAHMVPRSLVLVTELPRNTNGKIDRHALQEDLPGALLLR